MNFVHAKGMATLALLLTLPVAAFENTAYAGPDPASPGPMDDANVVDAWVHITDIYLQGGDDRGSDRVYLLENASETRSLMGLESDVASLVQGAMVPVGTYGQLRIVISEGCLRTADGTVYASRGYGQCGEASGRLRMPSYGKAGLKVLLNEIEVSAPSEVMRLDFDASQAYGRATGRNGWTMAPVIAGAGVTLTTAIEVSLSPGTTTIPTGVDLDQFSATLLPEAGDSARVSFADEDGDGIHELAFRSVDPEAGPFDVRLNPPDNVTVDVTPSTPATVSPMGGETAAVNWVLLSVTQDGGSGGCAWWICGL